MRVSSEQGETEAFHGTLGRITVLGVGAMALRDFLARFTIQPNRRNGERRETRERRRIPSAGLRRKPRRRWDSLTELERDQVMRGIEAVEMLP